MPWKWVENGVMIGDAINGEGEKSLPLVAKQNRRVLKSWKRARRVCLCIYIYIVIDVHTILYTILTQIQ